MHHWLLQCKYSLLPPIKQRHVQKQLYIHPYERLVAVSNGFCIKVYEVNRYYKLNVSLNALKCKDTIQDNHIQALSNGKKIIRDVIHIITIEPFINSTIENYHIDAMHKFSG